MKNCTMESCSFFLIFSMELGKGREAMVEACSDAPDVYLPAAYRICGVIPAGIVCFCLAVAVNIRSWDKLDVCRSIIFVCASGLHVKMFFMGRIIKLLRHLSSSDAWQSSDSI